MEAKSDRTVTIAVIAGVVALLLGLCMGALAGGVGGYLIGRQSVSVSTVAPSIETPLLPQVPGLDALSGAYVREVIAGSPAEKAGIRVGDIITGVDDTPVDANHRLVDVMSGYKPGDRITVKLWRSGATRTLDVSLGQNADNAALPYLGVRYSDISPERLIPTPED